MRSNRAGRTSEINPLQMAICEGFFLSPHHSPHEYKNQTFSSPFSGHPRPACGLHAGQVRRLGCVRASILKRHVLAVARHHVGQVGHVGQVANNSEAYQRFFLPDMAFPMSGACRACRARPTSWGIIRDGWKGMGRMRHVGGMGRCAPHRTAFPLAASLSGRPRPACGLHAGQVRRLGCVRASILKRHVLAVARHHVGQVGHVGQATNNSKAYQRFFLPDMAFPMSGVCRACRARPTSWGHQTGRMEGHGPDAARGRHGRHAPHRTAFPLAAGLSGRPRPACGLHTGQVRQLGCAGASILKRHAFAVARHHVKGTTKTPQGQEVNQQEFKFLL